MENYLKNMVVYNGSGSYTLYIGEQNITVYEQDLEIFFSKVLEDKKNINALQEYNIYQAELILSEIEEIEKIVPIDQNESIEIYDNIKTICQKIIDKNTELK